MKKKIIDNDGSPLAVPLFMGLLITLFLLNAPNLINVLGRASGTEAPFSTVAGEMEATYRSSFYGRTRFVELNGLGAKLLGQHQMNDVIRLRNGTFIMAQRMLEHEAKGDAISTVNLSAYLNGCHISYLQVIPPSKVCMYDKELPPGIEDFSNENWDVFSADLKRAGVDVLDLRERFHEEDLNHYEFFYRSDHHWTIEGAFWAFTQISSYLNHNCGFDIDPYLTDRDHYQTVRYPNSFLGSYGQRTGRYFTGVDDFELILPSFETNLTVEKADSGIVRTGTFQDAVIDPEQAQQTVSYAGSLYASYIGIDESLIKLRNNTPLSETEAAARERQPTKKILFLKDSYALPVISFLSLANIELDAIDLRLFSQNELIDYIQAFQPDIVVNLAYHNEIGNGVTFHYGVMPTAAVEIPEIVQAGNIAYSVDFCGEKEELPGQILIEGWGYQDGQDMREMDVYLMLTFEDGERRCYATNCNYRADLIPSFGEESAYGGYACSIPTQSIPGPPAKVEVVVAQDNLYYGS